ncbi:MAG: 1-acyl-sn-glycerol-3-phosphate acyltransferase [Chloroflexi bacterium HGW-Chloroflexi-10]|nr:MAG: 1-acyl-sn-glycerol-3-phosphate acyltransferase [Chloroflexi bacterium HGW-Chloroflexi-10]
MKANIRAVNWFLRRIFQTICRIDVEEFKKVPVNGPIIMVGNHINFLEAPVLLPHLDNPAVVGMAKSESWKNPLFNFLFNNWGVIPIDRGVVDREAFRLSEEALLQGKILAISPEGTRSKDGRLLQGKPGVVALALRSNAPMLPIAFYGYENFWNNLKHFRRTDFHLVVGKPFRLNMNGDTLSRDVRQAVTDEIMYKIAELLPEKYRGHYQFNDQVSYHYVVSEG